VREPLRPSHASRLKSQRERRIGNGCSSRAFIPPDAGSAMRSWSETRRLVAEGSKVRTTLSWREMDSNSRSPVAISSAGQRRGRGPSRWPGRHRVLLLRCPGGIGPRTGPRTEKARFRSFCSAQQAIPSSWGPCEWGGLRCTTLFELLCALAVVLQDPLARERAFEPVQELRGRVDLVVVLALGEDG
jgi:hypothetical protein